ncbi:MAG TPA: hypothetical protein VMM92_11730, partial [Thermoanaerobaculia bacterium]|nr:hypothetical protein [Thermoanaerobaculia bacterium]
MSRRATLLPALSSAVAALACLTWAVAPGASASALAGAPAAAASSPSFGRAATAFEQDVLAIDPAGKGRGISAPTLSLPGGYRYQVRAKFTLDRSQKDNRQEFVRSVNLYEWRGRSGADCSSLVCWVSLQQFVSEDHGPEKVFDVPKDTRWLLE